MATIYTYGYSGRTPADLLGQAEQRAAIVYDIRYNPTSRVPHWRYGQLAHLLGERYRLLGEYGNPNYRGGPICLYDPEGGAARVQRAMPMAASVGQHNVILLCACRDWQTCHRRLAAEHLAAATGWPVVHL